MYRINKAAEETEFGDVDPADFYSREVLVSVRSDQLATSHIHIFPSRAIEKIKLYTMPNTIHFIGTDPPFVI